MTDRSFSTPTPIPLRDATEGVRPLLSPNDALATLALSSEELDDRCIVGFNSRDSRSRPYHLLRTQMTKLMVRNGWRLIGITSATPGAGKTFTSVNLAASLAPTADATVLLCDLDLRRGSIAEMLRMPPQPGLGDYLAGDIDDPREIAFRINDSRLVVIPTTPSRASSSELLATPRYRSFMQQLRAMPEDTRIVCDLPPAFASDDAMMSMQQLDAYLLVVDHGTTTARQVEEALRLLDPVPCMGAVLNRYQGGFADPYGYGYGDTYGIKSYE